MAKSISEIKTEYKNCNEGGYSAFISMYEDDERKGVRSLVAAAQKKIILLEKERERIYAMREFERKYEDEYDLICGIDEAGRGPLAGPVVAGAVIFQKNTDILYINDSKKLSAAKRDELFDVIQDKALCYAVGMASHKEIDEVNILNATYMAMRRAIDALEIKPGLLLNDAVVIPDISIKQVGIIKGDSKSVSIAAASIIAKVTRDRLMEAYDMVYPGYGFAKHKGYGTKEHYAALEKLGPTPIHRRTFIKCR